MRGLVCAAHPNVPGLFAAARTAERHVYVRRTLPGAPDIVCEEQTVVVPARSDGAAGRLTALAWAPLPALPLVLAVGDDAGVVWFLAGSRGSIARGAKERDEDGSSSGSETEPEEPMAPQREQRRAQMRRPRVLSSAELTMDRVCFFLALSLFPPLVFLSLRFLGGSRTQPRRALNAHTAPVEAVQFHPFQPQLLLTCARDWSARLFNVQTATCIAHLVCFEPQHAMYSCLSCVCSFPPFSFLTTHIFTCPLPISPPSLSRTQPNTTTTTGILN